MSPTDFLAWRQHMGMSQRAAAQALGVSLPTLQAWERGHSFQTGKPVEIDKRTALACAALAAGIDPYSEIEANISPTVRQETQQVRTLISAIATKIHGLKVAPTTKCLESSSLYHAAFEHSESIVNLVESSRTGSAMALIRPALECYVRGAWIYYCAPEDTPSTNSFPNNRKLYEQLRVSADTNTITLLDRVEQAVPSNIRNSLVHGGAEQIHSRFDQTIIRPNFTNDQLTIAMRFSAGIATLSGAGMAKNAQQPDIEKSIFSYLDQLAAMAA